MTVEDLLAVVRLVPAGPMGWSERCPERAPGVYVVTCAANVRADGETVRAGEIAYVGKATRLRNRLSQFSRQTFERGSRWGGVRVLHIPTEAPGALGRVSRATRRRARDD